MNIASLKTFFRRKSHGQPKSAALVPRARAVWEGTILALIFLALGILVFDGYIFIYKVLDLEQQSADIGTEGEVQNIQNSLFREVIAAMKHRAELFSGAATGTPLRNPFLEKEEKKK